MKWGVQQVRVTLEDSESGETVVIEQSPDGRVKCEGAKARRGERAANTPPAAEAKTAREPAAKADKPKPARKRAAKEVGETGPRKPRASRKPEPEPEPAPAPTPGTALEWSPVKDHEYDGFAAPSAAGQFKVLISKNSQWALFYELKGTWPKHIACFAKLDKAKLRAQELHDAGWPESEFGPITAGQVARACPAPWMVSTLLPMPSIGPPSMTKKRARSCTCGSQAALRSTVVPRAAAAAHSAFSVPVTLGSSRKMSAPVRPAPGLVRTTKRSPSS